MPQVDVQRAALGRVANIGDLYDIRTDNFTGNNLFGSKLKDVKTDSFDDDTPVQLVQTNTDNFQEKFDQLNVERELQLSVLSGLVKLSGSGEYLCEEKKSARAQSMSLIYRSRTENEEVMIRKYKDKIDMDMLLCSKEHSFQATHVVSAIDWGAVYTITCEDENKEDKDVVQVKEGVSAQIDILKEMIDGNGYGKVADGDQIGTSHRKFTFKCKADISVQDLPITLEAAVEFAKTFPDLVKHKNDGKGVPLTFMLTPLDTVIKKCALKIPFQMVYTAIDDGIFKKCVEDVEGIIKTKQTLYDIHKDLHVYSNYLPIDESHQLPSSKATPAKANRRSRFEANPEILTIVDETFQSFCETESGYLGKLQKTVKDLRLGLISQETFFETSKEIPDELSDKQIEKFRDDFNKVKSIKMLKRKGIKCIGRGDDFIVDDKATVYVFYKTGDYGFDKNQELFLRLHKTHCRDARFIVVEEKVRNDIWPKNTKKTTIHKYVRGKTACQDMYAVEGQDIESCLINIKNPKTPKATHKPINRANVKLRCPYALFGKEEERCINQPVMWMCSKCKLVLEYGIDTKRFYCKCGESDPHNSRFRCNDLDHGMNYVQYPKKRLDEELSKLRAMQETNILILGETGVGKSTWINGFINYLHYADLEEAIKAKKLQVMIPSSFTFTQDGQEKQITIGEGDDNENTEVGKSATKEPRSYVFYLEEQKIRLIDTPGVGDSEGIQQDKKNFDNILSYLAKFEDIHAVCILLKPNNARLTAMFRFCIQELLAHLHTSVKDNIVFCFTNSRSTFYQPGDTLPALNAELDNREVGFKATPKNYFCFDNEPFRFLACMQNKVTFSKEDIDTYSKSWNKSVQETKRLFEHIKFLTPHKVRNTVNMNEARRVILAMSKPLAEVAKTIEQNVQQGQEYKEKIDKDNRKLEDLQKTLNFSGFNVQIMQLDYPRTVCAHKKCVKFVRVGKEKIQNTVYEQVCHHHCSIRGVPTETTNDPRLQGCWCITGTKCRACGHDYKEHMHITYDTKIVETQFLSDDVQAEINENKSLKAVKENAKGKIDTKIKELMQEKQIIMKTCAKYGTFLKANAIIPYNDAVGDYLDMMIHLEREKPAGLRNNTLLSTMEKMKKQYEMEREILDGAISTNSGENTITPDDVMELQKELFRLKHMGETLQDLFDGISIANSANSIAFQEIIAPPSQYKAKHSAENHSQTALSFTFKQQVRQRASSLRRHLVNFFSSKSEKES